MKDNCFLILSDDKILNKNSQYLFVTICQIKVYDVLKVNLQSIRKEENPNDGSVGKIHFHDSHNVYKSTSDILLISTCHLQDTIRLFNLHRNNILSKKYKLHDPFNV